MRYQLWFEFTSLAGFTLLLFSLLTCLFLQLSTVTPRGGVFGRRALLRRSRLAAFALPLGACYFLVLSFWSAWRSFELVGSFFGWSLGAGALRWAFFVFTLGSCVLLWLSLGLGDSRSDYTAELLSAAFLIFLVWSYAPLTTHPLTLLLLLEFLIVLFFLLTLYASVFTTRAQDQGAQASQLQPLRFVLFFLWVNALATLALCLALLTVGGFMSFDLSFAQPTALKSWGGVVLALSVFCKFGLIPMQAALVGLYARASLLSLALYLVFYYLLILWVGFWFFSTLLGGLYGYFAFFFALLLGALLLVLVTLLGNDADVRYLFLVSSLVNLTFFGTVVLLLP